LKQATKSEEEGAEKGLWVKRGKDASLDHLKAEIMELEFPLDKNSNKKAREQ